jgi:hypothetical protein
MYLNALGVRLAPNSSRPKMEPVAAVTDIPRHAISVPYERGEELLGRPLRLVEE